MPERPDYLKDENPSFWEVMAHFMYWLDCQHVGAADTHPPDQNLLEDRVDIIIKKKPYWDDIMRAVNKHRIYDPDAQDIWVAGFHLIFKETVHA